jgi:hypothetical protein
LGNGISANVLEEYGKIGPDTQIARFFTFLVDRAFLNSFLKAMHFDMSLEISNSRYWHTIGLLKCFVDEET